GECQIVATARSGNVWSQVLRENVTVQIGPDILLFNTEESIQIGEDWDVNVLLPGDSGYVDAELRRTAGESIMGWGHDLEGTNSFVFRFSGEDMLERGVVPGAYTLTIYYDHDGNQQIRSFPVTFTGELPVQSRFTGGPFSVSAGDTICLTGNAGSATWFEVEWESYTPGGQRTGHGWIQPELDADGDWSLEVTAGDAGYYQFSLHGTNDEGLSTGNASFRTNVLDATFLAAPTVVVNNDNPDYTEIIAQPAADIQDWDNVYWFISCKAQNEGRYSFMEYYPPDSDGHFRYEFWTPGYEETYDDSVFYEYDGVYSAPAALSFTMPGDPYPVNGQQTISLSVPDEWTDGTDLTITWTPGAEDQSLIVELFREENETLTNLMTEYNLTDSEEIEIPGYLLREGSYVIHCSAQAEDYFSAERSYRFQVLPNPQAPAVPAVHLTPEVPTFSARYYCLDYGQTYDDVSYVIYFWDASSENWEERERESFGDATREFNFHYAFDAGLWKIEAAACQNGIWSAPAVIQFEVSQPPQLDPVTLAQPLPEIQINKRLSITVSPVEHATSYTVWLWQETEDQLIFRNTVYVQAGNTAPVVINLNEWPESAQPGSGYLLQIGASAPGYSASILEFHDLTVTRPSYTIATPTDLQICTKNGEPLTAEQQQNLYEDKIVPVRVSYGEDMQMIALRLVENGMSTSGAVSFTVDPASRTWIAQYRPYCSAGDYAVEARVMSGDMWSPWSEPVPFRLISVPQADEFTITPDQTELNIGEDLTITVGNIDPRFSVLDVITSGNYHQYTSFSGPTVTFTVPEEYLSSGSNTISISLRGNQVTDLERECTVTVNGERPAAPQVTFSADSAAYGDILYATVEAQGATQVQMKRYEDSYYAVQNGTAVIPITYQHYAPYNEHYRFRVRTGGIWSEWTQETVIASLSARPTFDSQNFAVIPTEIVPGQDLEITFLPVEGITDYYISMEYGAGGYFYDEYDVPGTVRIPAFLFRDGGSFGFDIGAGVAGAPDLLCTAFILNCAPFAEGVLQPLTVSAVETELAYGEDAQISLGSVQAEQVAFQQIQKISAYSYGDVWGNDARIWAAPPGETTSVARLNFGSDSGTQTIRASARVNGVWTDWSNPVTFTIAQREPDLLRNPVPQVAAEIEGGRPAHITWSAADHAQYYEVNWAGPIGWYKWTTMELYADLPAANLSEGVWNVWIVSLAQGYENDGYSERVQFTVTEGTAPVDSRLRLPDGLTTIESEAFVGIAVESVYIPESVISIAADAFDDDITIYGVEGSYAETYAESRNLPFVPNE
nr:leucine-rich repeat domain-containing protein [Clostridiales bacterium]